MSHSDLVIFQPCLILHRCPSPHWNHPDLFDILKAFLKAYQVPFAPGQDDWHPLPLASGHHKHRSPHSFPLNETTRNLLDPMVKLGAVTSTCGQTPAGFLFIFQERLPSVVKLGCKQQPNRLFGELLTHTEKQCGFNHV